MSPKPTRPGYEKRDVNARAIAWTALAFVIGAVVMNLAVRWELTKFKRYPFFDPSISIGAQEEKIPQRPRLETTELLNAKEYIRREMHLLSTYGWIDENRGIARIPVERAMELYVAQH